MLQGGGSAPFIYSPVGCTCVVGPNRLKTRAEMHRGRRWKKTPEDGGKTLGGTTRPTPGLAGPTWQGFGPRLLWVPSTLFPRPDDDVSFAVKFHVFYAL
jgi:hypothetical protein